MYRLKWLIVISLLFIFLLTACGQESTYGKLMSQADEAFLVMDLEEALRLYDELLELDAEKLKYGEGRHHVVRALRDRTEVLQYELESLKDRTAYIRELVEETAIDYENINQWRSMYQEIESLYYQLENYPNTSMYQDVKQYKDNFNKEIKSNAVDPAIDDLEKFMEDFAFDQAQSSLNYLSDIQYFMPELIQINIDDYFHTIEIEKEKYVDFPQIINERNLVLLDEEYGKISIIGEGIRNNYITLYYKMEGDIRGIIDEFDINVRVIYSDGSHADVRNMEFRHFKDHTMAIQSVSRYEGQEIARIDYRLGFSEEEEMSRLVIENNNPNEVLIPGVMKFPSKEITINAQLENDEVVVELTNMEIDSNRITLIGSMTAKQDIYFDNTFNLSVPLSGEFSQRRLYDNLFEGIPKEIRLDYHLNHVLTDSYEYINVSFKEEQLSIDLLSGEIYTSEEPVAIADKTIRADEDTELFISYDRRNNKLFQDADGNKYANVIVFGGTIRYSWFSSTKNEKPIIDIPLDNKYSRLTLDVGLDNNYSAEEYGTSTLKIYGDKELLQEIKLSKNASTTSIDLDVNNVHLIKFEVEHKEGDSGFQRILLGNGWLYSK